MQCPDSPFCLPPTPESELHLEQANRSISAREGEEVTLGCLLQDTYVPTARLSASWFRGEEGGHPRTLLTLRHDGSIEYPQEGLAGRLQLRRPAAGDFSLTLGGVEVGDAGLYHCQLQEWQQRDKGEWALQAWARSGYTRLTAIPKGKGAAGGGCLPLACWGGAEGIVAVLC